jgi:hypothetical protein
MNGMKLGFGQKLLAAAVLTIAAGVTPVFFIVMFVTVNHLLGPSFDGWAWTVPVATEATFTLLFLWAVLMEWLRRPRRVLWLAPYPFALMSAFLNVWASHGSLAGMAGHLAVTLAFFTPVTFAKAGVRSLLVTDEERAGVVTLADAKAHARDMLRSALGIWWHWKAPILLRRQLRSGRLPAKVMEAVGNGARYGGATVWEPAVEAWIAAAVTLPERTAEVLRAARAEASAPVVAGAPQDPSASTAAAPPGGPSPEAPATHPATTPATPSRGTSGKPRRLVPGKASDDDLAALIIPLLADGEVTPTRVVKVIREHAGGKASIGHDRAGKVLALATEQAQRVVPIGDRRQA